ncbi:MAG: GHMP kinase, partial [Kiritimatiellia bacterium]
MIGTTIHAVAPTRICDVGGWTDTWFSETGKIFNIAVSPLVEVQIRVLDPNGAAADVMVRAENYQETYRIDPASIPPGKHPLIEAALSEIRLPENVQLEVNIYSSAPPGASMCTSAA